MFRRKLVDWNVSKLINEFREPPPPDSTAAGPPPIVSMIAAHAAQGFDPLSFKQVAMWAHRRTIPTTRLAEVFATLIAMRKPANRPLEPKLPVQIVDYLIASAEPKIRAERQRQPSILHGSAAKSRAQPAASQASYLSEDI